MSYTIDLLSLFEPVHGRKYFDTLEDELRAIRDGTKAMSYFSFAAEETHPLAFGEAHAEVHAVAHALGLLVVDKPDIQFVRGKRFEFVTVFVLKEADLWRVPAFEVLKASPGGDANLREWLRSSLLGYSDEQIREWLALLNRLSIRSGGASLYLLLGSRAHAEAQDLGMRSLPVSAAAADILAFRCPSDMDARPDAQSSLSDDTVLRRARVAFTFMSDLFGTIQTPKKGVESIRLTSELAIKINQHLYTNLERLVDGVWVEHRHVLVPPP